MRQVSMRNEMRRHHDVGVARAWSLVSYDAPFAPATPMTLGAIKQVLAVGGTTSPTNHEARRLGASPP